MQLELERDEIPLHLRDFFEPVPGPKPKDALGIPWLTAFALRADGWYLRSAITWVKGNPMPESVTDRPTNATEMIFLLAKKPTYYYDADAISEPAQQPVGTPALTAQHKRGVLQSLASSTLGTNQGATTRNKRNWWHVNTAPYPAAHFATFPPKLIEPCILAGTSQRGACGRCGAPWRRVSSRGAAQPEVAPSDLDRFGTGEAGVHRKVGGQYQKWLDANPKQTTGWEPSCACDAATVPCVVLDPFAGAGTTGLVAKNFGRHFIGIELNEEYAGLIVDRLRQDVLALEAVV